MTDLHTLQIANNHINWYTRIMRALVFPENTFGTFEIAVDDLYKIENDFSPLANDEKLKTLSQNFIETGLFLTKVVSDDGKDKAFNDFDNVFNEIIYSLEHLHKETAPENTTFASDQFLSASFGSYKAFVKDIDTEIQKVKRHNYQFTLLLIRPRMKNTLGQQEFEKLCSIIFATLRPYDQGYIPEDNDSIALCLKYTNAHGGLSAYDRIKEEVQNHETDDQTTYDLVACLYEPKEYDKSETLPNDLAERLDTISPDQNIIISREEDSDLIQYLLNKPS